MIVFLKKITQPSKTPMRYLFTLSFNNIRKKYLSILLYINILVAFRFPKEKKHIKNSCLFLQDTGDG